MPDRIDPSQYPEEINFDNFTVDPLNLTADDWQVNPDKGDPAPVAFTDYLDHENRPDVLERFAEKFLTVTGAAPVARTVYRQIPGGGGIVQSGRGVFMGCTAVETGGTACWIAFRDGTDSGAPLIAAVSLPANGGSSLLPARGIAYRYGLYVQINGAGTVSGALYTEQEHRA